MEIKLLAVDLDGTLLRSDRTLSPANERAVRRLTEAGTMVVLCTARPPRSTVRVWQRLDLDTPIIAYNGAMVKHLGTGQVWSHYPLSVSAARVILETAWAVDREVVISLEVEDRWITDARGASIITATASEGFAPDEICNLREALTRPISKVLVSQSPDVLRELQRRLESVLPDRVQITKTEDYLLQITSRRASKAFALAATSSWRMPHLRMSSASAKAFEARRDVIWRR